MRTALTSIVACCLLTAGIYGQASTGAARTIAIHAAGFSLPAELARMDEMLRTGELDIASSQADTMVEGRIHERLKQVYEGVPVFGGQLARQMDGRSVISLSGRLYDGIDIGVTPRISSAAAGNAALASLSGSSIRHSPVLWVIPTGDRYVLGYRVEVEGDWDIRDVDVDALSGQVIASRSALRSDSTIGIGTGVFGDREKMSVNATGSGYRAIDGLRPAPIFTFDFRGSLARLNAFLNTGALFNSDIAASSNNTWTDGPTVDAHAYQGMVYDYYFKRYGRHGLDDHDLEIDAIVHPLDRSQASRVPPDVVGTFINNAFFCCDDLTFFGDGDGRTLTYLAGALEIVGHEMSHGVTQYGADLIYQDESGALNEAFSDIMATAMDFFYHGSKGNWLLGDEVTISPPGYIRSFSNPAAVGDPDHYSLRRFIGTDTDDGGVHFNVTIIDHAFYLAVAGGRNRVSGITVTGIGQANIDHMERIFYRGFEYLLTPNARFSDARAATLQAATDLYGSGSNERTQLAAAWNAVGVN